MLNFVWYSDVNKHSDSQLELHTYCSRLLVVNINSELKLVVVVVIATFFSTMLKMLSGTYFITLHKFLKKLSSNLLSALLFLNLLKLVYSNGQRAETSRKRNTHTLQQTCLPTTPSINILFSLLFFSVVKSRFSSFCCLK